MVFQTVQFGNFYSRRFHNITQAQFQCGPRTGQSPTKAGSGIYVRTVDSLCFITRTIFVYNTPNFIYVPRIEYVREYVDTLPFVGEPIFEKPRFNFVDEDASKPSIFWKLREYYMLKPSERQSPQSPKIYNEERLEKLTNAFSWV